MVHLLFPFHRGRVFATTRHAIAFGAIEQRVLRQKDVSFLTAPNFQGRLLDGAGKGERERPGQSLSEAKVHRVQPGGGQLAGLTTGQESDPGTAAGTVRKRHFTVASATSSTVSWFRQAKPEAPCWASRSYLPT